MLSQKEKQFKFSLSKSHILAVHAHRLAGRAEYNAAVNRFTAGSRCRAAQYGGDARHDLTQGKRFGDVIVGSQAETLECVVFSVFCGEENDGQVFCGFIITQALGQFEARHAPQHHVKQD